MSWSLVKSDLSYHCWWALIGPVSLPLSTHGQKYDTLPAPVDKLRLLVLGVHYDVGGLDELHDV